MKDLIFSQIQIQIQIQIQTQKPTATKNGTTNIFVLLKDLFRY
jgi:hypothetical protein